MGITFIGTTATNQNTSPQGVAASVTKGNFLIAMCFSNNTGTMSISDTAGNIWTPTQAVFHGGSFEQIFTATAKSTTITTITLTAVGATVQMLVGVYSGVGPFDTQVNSAQIVSNLTTFSSGSLTPAAAGELGIFLFSTSGGTTCSISTITSGWNVRANFPGTAGTQVLAYADNLSLPSGSQSVSGTLSTAQKSDIIFAAFSPNSGTSASWLTANLNNSLRGLRH